MKINSLTWIVVLIYIIFTASIVLTSPDDYQIIMGSVLYGPIIIALFFIYTDEEYTTKREKISTYYIKSYLKFMSIFNYLFSRTVSSRYSKLLNLFRQTHKSFTIIENEEFIVKFTLQGLEPNSLLYGTIEQYFNEKKIDGGNFTFDPSKWVRVSLYTTYGEQTIHIEKSFHQSDDQTTIYNSVMQAYLAESMKVVNSINSEEIIDKEDNKQVEDTSTQKGNHNLKSWSLLEFAREHGKMQVGTFLNKETNEEFKACIFTTTGGIKTFVAFGSKLGELSPKEITQRKNSLRVAQLESGNYSLYEDPEKNWQDVNLGI